jgi:hypothetical protein
MKHQNLQLSKFKLEIIRELIVRYGAQKTHIGRPFSAHPLRLTARHFPSVVPPNDDNRTPQRRCYICSNTERRAKQRSDTRYQCTECDVGLCVIDCFKDFHTLQKIWHCLVQICESLSKINSYNDFVKCFFHSLKTAAKGLKEKLYGIVLKVI